ncbi:MAG: polysaccharide biosynthesis protein [bacterium]|nr:polysaccharide biosynthesis protein [bacterium]
MKPLGGRLLRAAGFHMLGNILRIALGVVGSVLLVRWLGSEEFGRASFILSLVMHLGIIGSAGIGIPFVTLVTRYRLAEDGAAITRLLGRVFLFRALVSAVLFLLWAVSLWMPAGWLGRTGAEELLLQVPILALISYLSGSAMRLLISHYDQGFVSLLGGLEIAVKIVLTFLIGQGRPTASDLLWATIAAEMLGLVLGLLRAYFKLGLRPGRPRIEVPGLRNLLRRAFHPYLLSLALRVVGRDVDVLLLGLLAGGGEVFRYVIPFSLATLALSLTGSALNSTTILSAFRELETEHRRSQCSRLLRTLVEFFLITMLPVAVGGMLLGGDLLLLLYGEEARGLGPVSLLLFAAFAANGLAGIAKDSLQGLGADKLAARSYLIGGLVNLTLSIAWIPAHGAEGAALATLLGALLAAAGQFLSLARQVKFRVGPRTVIVTLLATSVMGLVVALISRSHQAPPTLPGTLLSVLAGVVVYVLTLRVLQPRTSLKERFAHGHPASRLLSPFL